MNALSSSDIEGSWALDSFDIEKPDKSVSRWGKSAKGLLIFAPSGHMSVSINRELGEGGSEAQRIFDSILFYAGTFRIDGDVVYNLVENASNPARIGKEMTRYATLADDLLTLTTPQEAFGRATLRWRRIK